MALFQVCIGGRWYDNVDLGVETMDEVAWNVQERPIQNHDIYEALPFITELVLKHYGGEHYETTYFDWSVDNSFISYKHDVIKANFRGSFRRHHASNGDWQPDHEFECDISIMPGN